MKNNLYVCNLAFSMRDNDLEQAFAEFGAVVSAKVVADRFSGRSKGFGFVEMGSEAEAEKAIEQLNNKEIQGRVIRVAHAKPKEDVEQK